MLEEDCLRKLIQTHGGLGFACYDEQLPRKVIFSGPATVAFFYDGEKVVSKCSPDDEYDKAKGLMVCVLKHLGVNVTELLKEWCAGE